MGPTPQLHRNLLKNPPFQRVAKSCLVGTGNVLGAEMSSRLRATRRLSLGCGGSHQTTQVNLRGLALTAETGHRLCRPHNPGEISTGTASGSLVVVGKTGSITSFALWAHCDMNESNPNDTTVQQFLEVRAWILKHVSARHLPKDRRLRLAALHAPTLNDDTLDNCLRFVYAGKGFSSVDVNWLKKLCASGNMQLVAFLHLVANKLPVLQMFTFPTSPIIHYSETCSQNAFSRARRSKKSSTLPFRQRYRRTSTRFGDDECLRCAKTHKPDYRVLTVQLLVAHGVMPRGSAPLRVDQVGSQACPACQTIVGPYQRKCHFGRLDCGMGLE